MNLPDSWQMFAAQHSNERHARTAPSQRAHWKKVKHHKVALSHACDLAGHLNVRLLEARLAAGTAESLRNLLPFRSFFSLLRPEFGACILIRSDIRSDMVQRCPSACTPAASDLRTRRTAQRPVETCSHRQVMEPHQHGAAGHTGPEGAGGDYYRKKYVSAGFLRISNSCERQMKGAAA